MISLQRTAFYLAVSVIWLPSFAQSAQRAAIDRQQHDFDFDIGVWNSRISRLKHPLKGSTTWLKTDATVTVSNVWDGRANIEELEADDSTGHIGALALRLYNPQTHEWTLNAATSGEGTLSTMSGGFNNGRGEFFSQETVNGRTVLVRQVWSDIQENSHHFEQAYSDDGGKTWEANWIANLTRITAGSKDLHTGIKRDWEDQFAFNTGAWRIRISLLPHPLTGSKERIALEGRAAVRKIWDGRAYLEELRIDDPRKSIEGLALRLYNPEARQWNLYWVNSKDGTIGTPMVGGFSGGRGAFYDAESLHGKTILVHEDWSDITADSCHFEQAFSGDGGKTWETNWMADWTREPEKKDGGRINEAERAFLLEQLENSKRDFLAAITGLTDAQWTFKPSAAVWSVEEGAEHIILAEDFLFDSAPAALKLPAVARPDASTLEHDRAFVVRLLDRSSKATAPAAIVPTGKIASPTAASEIFTAKRDDHIAYVRKTHDDLRAHTAQVPGVGVLDAYQIMVMMAAHSVRHTEQIREVQARNDYPRN
jgi:DinB superfamily